MTAVFVLVFTYEIDERLGLLVGRHHVGTDPGTVPTILQATRRLALCPKIARQPKVELLFVDADATHPGAREREQIADAWQTMSGDFLFAMVTVSSTARAALAVVSVLRAPKHEASVRNAFATRDEALAWIETRRPGIRADLLRLDARRQSRENVDDAEAPVSIRTSIRIARTGA